MKFGPCPVGIIKILSESIKLGLRVTRCGLRVAGCELRVTGCGLRVASCRLVPIVLVVVLVLVIEKETVASNERHGIGCQEFGSWKAECGKYEKAQSVRMRSNLILLVLVLILVLVNRYCVEDEYDDEYEDEGGRAAAATHNP